MREYTEGYWYRDGAGAVGIPLFTYLYHEYAIGYGGDSANIGPRGVNTAWNVRCHAVNLVTGKTPGAATWMSPDQLFNSDPRAVKMIRNHRRLLAAGASRQLMEGRMLHPFTLEAPTLNYALTRWEGGKSEQFTFAESAVLTSSWQAPDGSVGHLFVNLSPDGQPLEVDVDTRNIQGGGPYDVSMYRSGAGDRFQPLWKAEALPKRLNTTLAPDEVLFLELRSSKHTP